MVISAAAVASKMTPVRANLTLIAILSLKELGISSLAEIVRRRSFCETSPVKNSLFFAITHAALDVE